jgi:hypothetical protein
MIMSDTSTSKTTPAAEAPVAKTRYLIVVLPPNVVEANAALTKASDDGYTKLLNVYVVSTPSSASTAFAVLSA